MIKRNEKKINAFMVVCDILSVFISLLLAYFIRFKTNIFAQDEGYLTLHEYLRIWQVVIPLYLIIYYVVGLYRARLKDATLQDVRDVVNGNILGILMFTLILFIRKYIDYSRYVLLLFFAINVILTIIIKFIIRYIIKAQREKGINVRNILILGYSEQAISFCDKIMENKHWGYKIYGILEDNINIAQENIESEKKYIDKIIGKLELLDPILSENYIDEVFLTLNYPDYKKVDHIINLCEKNGIRAYIIPNYYKYLPAKPEVEEVDGLPIIKIRHIPLDNSVNMITKRLVDIFGSLVALIVFSPVMIITALIIKITSPGPIVFRQERIGMNSKTFIMYKFRSMHIQKESDEISQWTTKSDSRKTPFGAFIRKTSIDELPQLINVLKGDMSLVGPRPERPYFVNKFKEEIPKYMVKHQVRPGITGWAQANGLRGDTSIEDRVKFDIYYIENWRFLFDVKIILMTIKNGFVNKNAY